MENYRSGLRELDTSLWGSPGIPPGSLIEFTGDTAGGKNALALQYLRQAQEQGQDVAWVATETPLQAAQLAWSGIDAAYLLLVPQHSELCGLEAAAWALQAGCKAVVVDSLAALAGKEATGLKQLLSQHLAELQHQAERQGALVLLLNQERYVHGHRYHAATGPFLNRFLAATIRLTIGETLRVAGVPVGHFTRFELLANGPDPKDWGRSGRFKLHFEHGLLDLGARIR